MLSELGSAQNDSPEVTSKTLMFSSISTGHRERKGFVRLYCVVWWSEDGVGFGNLREEGGGWRAAPHARSTRVHCGKRTSQRPKGSGGAVRRDMHLRRPREAKDEVHEIPAQTHEHQTFSWPNPLPRPRQDLLAYRSWVCHYSIFKCFFFFYSLVLRKLMIMLGAFKVSFYCFCFNSLCGVLKFRIVFRRMIPHKTKRGEAALDRLKVYEGIPPPYDKTKRMVVPDALKYVFYPPILFFCDF